MIVSASLFILGSDYHLGDLLWFTTVLKDYREKVKPACVIVSVPDRPITRILDRNPLIDEVRPGNPAATRTEAERRFGPDLTVHDLRPFPIGITMVRDWRRRLPWLYYRDLWLEERGQWLATFLGLGRLNEHRPVLCLSHEDQAVARELPERYVALAPHVGQYTLPLAGGFWRRIKQWPAERWVALAQTLRLQGYHPYTLAAPGQSPIPGTTGLIGLPIRQVAGVIQRSSVLVTVESGLWFIAAALDVPFAIVPWWLPRPVDWPGSTGVPHARIFRDRDSTSDLLIRVNRLMGDVSS